jgi:hypothetical protein
VEVEEPFSNLTDIATATALAEPASFPQVFIDLATVYISSIDRGAPAYSRIMNTRLAS